MTLPEELQAARLRLVKERPYLAAAAWALQPVPRPGLGTLAVDQWWRLYYDPAVTTKWTVEELAGVLYHEICHLLRDHAARMKDLDRVAANIAADAEINDDLIGEGVRLPDEPIMPAMIGEPGGLLAEEYYEALMRAQKPAPRLGTLAQPEATGGEESPSGAEGGGEPGAGDTRQGDGDEAGDRGLRAADPNALDGSAQDTASASAPGSGAEDDGSDPSPTAAGGSCASEAQPGSRGDGPGSKAGDSGGSQPADSSAQPGSSSQPPTGPVGNGRAGGHDGGEPGGGAQTPAPAAGRCGSCATGQPEPWEDGPPGEGTTPGVSRAEAEQIRRVVARHIREHARSRGIVPGHWARWAEEKLRPRVDWRRELASAIRRAVADITGASDYSYRRPSRRQGQVGNGKVVLPALRCPVPSVAVVVDTSGSISDPQLAQALAEVAGILKAAGQREGVHVLACDSQVHACRRVFRSEQVKLAGGGGTDMRVGLEAAAKLRPSPQVIVVITDGETPWPEQPPKGMKVIVALTGEGKAPEWAKAIRIES